MTKLYASTEQIYWLCTYHFILKLPQHITGTYALIRAAFWTEVNVQRIQIIHLVQMWLITYRIISLMSRWGIHRWAIVALAFVCIIFCYVTMLRFFVSTIRGYATNGYTLQENLRIHVLHLCIYDIQIVFFLNYLLFLKITLFYFINILYAAKFVQSQEAWLGESDFSFIATFIIQKQFITLKKCRTARLDKSNLSEMLNHHGNTVIDEDEYGFP